MASRSALLAQVGLFKDIPETILEAIAELSQEMTFAKNKTVFMEGAPAKYIYILLEGEVSIQVSLTSRKETVTVAVINQLYHSFGWSGVVPPYHYTSSALCEADCRVLALEGKKLIDMLKQEPQSGFIVMQRISELISRRLRNSRIALLKTL